MRNKQRDLLIKLRSKLIGQQGVLPYCIYTDATIEDLLDAQPKSIDELVKVKGFPAKGKRVKGFGEAIVAVFTNPDKVQGFEIKSGASTGEIEVGTSLKRMSSFD